MPSRILFPEFRDELEFTRYPFGDTATLTTASGDKQLDADVLLDASLYPIGATGAVYLSQITVALRLVTLTFSDTEFAEVATGSFDPVAPPSLVPLADSYGRPAGLLVSTPERLARLAAWDTGSYTFEFEATALAASCVIPTPAPGVRGVLGPTGTPLTGDLWLVGDNGVVLSQVDDQTIRIDIVGDPLFLRRQCTAADKFTAPLFVRTINGCPPDAYGNFHLLVADHLAADTVIRVYPTADGLAVEVVGQTVV